MTTTWPEFLEIREDVLLKVLKIVGRSGTRLGLPTEAHYVSGHRKGERYRRPTCPEEADDPGSEPQLAINHCVGGEILTMRDCEVSHR